MNLDQPGFMNSYQSLGANMKNEKDADDAVYRSQTFISSYYKAFSRRAKNITRLYLENARISWNGKGYLKSVFETEIAEKMIGTTFTVLSSDCHPFYAGNVNRGVLVVVSGSMSNKSKTKQLFSQTFILSKVSEKSSDYYVQDDCFRYV